MSNVQFEVMCAEFLRPRSEEEKAAEAADIAAFRVRFNAPREDPTITEERTYRAAEQNRKPLATPEEHEEEERAYQAGALAAEHRACDQCGGWRRLAGTYPGREG